MNELNLHVIVHTIQDLVDNYVSTNYITDIHNSRCQSTIQGSFVLQDLTLCLSQLKRYVISVTLHLTFRSREISTTVGNQRETVCISYMLLLLNEEK